MRSRLLNRRIGFSVLVAGLLLFPARAAPAHVFLERSEPRVGSEVPGLPATVKLWFDGRLEPLFSTVKVIDAVTGKEVSLPPVNVGDQELGWMEIQVAPLPPGAYEVAWEAMARDGHLTRGKFRFTVKEPAADRKKGDH